MSRIERSIALAALLAVSLYLLFGNGGEWRGEWSWSIYYALGTTVLTAPLVAGLAAWLASSRHGSRAITDAAPRGWLTATYWATAAWALGMAALLGTVVVAVVATALTAHGGPIDTRGWGLAPLTLAAFAAAGAAAGTLVPHPVTAVMVAPMSFLAAMVGSKHDSFAFLRISLPSTGSLAGVRWSDATVLGSMAGLAGVLLAGLAVCLHGRPRRVAGPLSGACAVALLATSFVTSHAYGSYEYTASDERATACAGHAPEVCVMPSHVAALAALAAETDRLAPYLQRTGARLPARFAEAPWTNADTSVGAFGLNDGARTRVDAALAAEVLARPADCPAYSADTAPPEIAFTAPHLIASWLVQQAGGTPDVQSDQEAAWLRSPAAGQRSWVAQAYRLLTACDVAHLRTPWGGRT